ncbi:glycoside hydrolase family 3 protein [Ktedonospora formicarum]|uniref:Beta-glucosidase n=1 Tax=Ktedonospora formicarum TaxID=2778364 RepID=A0A8J3HYM1_9CHLR|nr:glycoside hydrolase family 3 protein [Ktedonospora formicarum]GHO42349.1 beta-glucosidase [Ktedonospora formicarum]
MSDYTQGMKLEDQIGQLISAGFTGTTPTPEIIDLIQNYRIGNIILFARNIESAAQVQRLTNELQHIAREAGHPYPLLISIDQENGMVRRFGRHATTFPGNMALGAIDSEQKTYEITHATGEELKALGINMNLAPVADVNNNPANPVIGVRSFGEDPQRVSQHLTAAIKGFQEAGVITNLKHFPGHGDTAVDSHKALPVIEHDLARLEAVELVPFRAGIANGADSIMIAHINLPKLMTQEMLPATISPEIVTGLLRERLGFGGVITTDCMEMDALANTVGTERGAVLALQAGVDIVLVSHTYQRQKGALEAVMAAVAAGELSAAQIEAAAERVLQLKASYLSWEDLPRDENLQQIDSPAHLELSHDAYARSTTLVRDNHHLIPLSGEYAQAPLFLFPETENATLAADRYPALEALRATIQAHYPSAQVIAVPSQASEAVAAQLSEAIAASTALVVITVNANRYQPQGNFVKRLLEQEKPIIGIAVHNPYDLLAYPDLGTYLVTYEYTLPAFESALAILDGTQSARGKLPVSLTGLHERG